MKSGKKKADVVPTRNDPGPEPDPEEDTATKEFKHILFKLFNQSSGSPLVKALAEHGCNEIHQFLSSTSEQINELSYTDETDGTVRKISTYAKKHILDIIRFHQHQKELGQPIEDWTNVSRKDYTDFLQLPPDPSSKPKSTSEPSPTAFPRTASPAELFQKGIKRDQSLFPTIKDERYQDSWHQEFHNQADAQGVADVLDPDYIPDESQLAVFKLKNVFLYAVLQAKVLHSKGKEIVRKHRSTKNSQAVYRDLLAYHRSSIAATFAANEIMAYLTSVTIGDGRFRGNTVDFLVHWNQQVLKYETLMGTASTLGEREKMNMLVRAVAPVPHLQHIKGTVDVLRTTSKTEVTFSEYYDLLSAAALQYDTTLRTKPKRMAYNHAIQDYEEPEPPYYNDDDYDDIDTPVYALESNVHARYSQKKPPPQHRTMGSSAKPKVKMQWDRWKNLSEDARATWDTLSDEDKAIILGQDTKTPSDDTRSSPRQAYTHATVDPQDEHSYHQDDHHVVAEETSETDAAVLHANQSQQSAKPTQPKYPPHDIRAILSQKSKPKSRQANMANIVYRVSVSRLQSSTSLVDRGANGGIAGKDVRVLATSDRSVDIQGIDNHQMTNVSIGSVAGLVRTNKGPVVLIMHQYAIVGNGHSIHAPAQWESFQHQVCDKSVHVGGKQRIKTSEGYLIPLAIVNGLPRLSMRPPTDREFDSLPHVVTTQDIDWNPSLLDFEYEADADADGFHALVEHDDHPYHHLFDEFGNYRRRVVALMSETTSRPSDNEFDNLIDQCCVSSFTNDCTSTHPISIYEHETVSPIDAPASPLVASIAPKTSTPKQPDFEQLRPHFGWIPATSIAKTFQNTTQLARTTTGTLLKQSYKAQNPALNVIRRNEPVATDELFSDTPAIDCGATSCQIFVGLNSDVVDVYPLMTSKQFVNALEDNVRTRGAMSKLVSDRAQVEISGRALEFLRVYAIPAWQSEPHNQHQNYAERKIQHLKQMTNTILDRTGAPPNTWLLCLSYVSFVLNHTWNDTLKEIPLTKLLGITVDISVLLRYHFWQAVYFKAIEPGFPSDTKENIGNIVGISEHVGHALTWKILDPRTNRVLHRSICRPVEPGSLNFRLDHAEGEISTALRPHLKSRTFDSSDDATPLDSIILETEDSNTPDTEHETAEATLHTDPVDGETLPTDHGENSEHVLISLEDLVGRTFVLDPDDEGQRFRARIVELVTKHDDDLQRNPQRVQFLCTLDNNGRDELLTYNQVMDYLNRDAENPVVWRYKRIVSHQGPLRPSHKDYKGSLYNIMLEWEGGEVTAEPLDAIAKDDPITCAIYAKENNLLHMDGWKRFKSLARRQGKFLRMAKQAFLHSYRHSTKYKYGFEVPKNYADAQRLDALNKNTRWQDATVLELNMVHEFQTFKDIGHKHSVRPPDGYKKIRVHLIYDVKHDGRFKARLVADGHLTDEPLESIYSGVVSLRGFRIVMFLAELNDLQFWATDVGNAYLESYTSEKVYIVAGAEFGEMQDHVLVIDRALYGLKSSGQRWHDRLHDCMQQLGFTPCKAEPDIWMKRNGNNWEYVAVYVDDLAIAMKEPEDFVASLTSPPNRFKLKGTGPITFHLGMDFSRDDDGTLCLEFKKYFEKMMANYERHFGCKPNDRYRSPLEKGDHPETDTSDFLDAEQTKLYQSLIGSLQWIVTIGRYDIMSAVVTMASFRAAPRVGHLNRLKRIYGYLLRMNEAKLRVRTEEPDYSGLSNVEFDWSRTVYGAIEEMLPQDAPEPLGKYVTLTHFVDANLMHDMITGRSMTGILHLLNKTPIDWFSKKQATVEIATYSSEMIAMRTCVEQIVDLRNTLRYLGVPIRKKSITLGDNESVVKGCSILHSKLHKRHNMLSFHFVREAVAAGFVAFYHFPGAINPADILSKHWGYADIWTTLKPLLFWMGDTMDT